MTRNIYARLIAGEITDVARAIGMDDGIGGPVGPEGNGRVLAQGVPLCPYRHRGTPCAMT
ncbi:hypothetical protein ACTXJ3_14990 [Brachybacterium paraconglomeratum]|uniref:hypothetical protein n=1 Tax=Brachybacterium paraconglomeratum TaxID=173362 RepID=UPI003FD292E4